MRVIELVREGITDSEIATHLGIGVWEVKGRIDRLVRTLGVSNRAGLAAWQSPVSGEATRRTDRKAPEEGERIIGETVAPSTSHGPSRRGAAVLAAAALTAGLLAGTSGGAFLGDVFGTGSGESPLAGSSTPGTQTPDAATATLGETPTPDPPDLVEGIDFIEISSGPLAPFPPDTVLIVVEGCCSGPPTALTRVWRGEGDVHRTELFVPESGSAFVDLYISSYGASRDGQHLLVTLTADQAGPDVARATTLYESTDAGATWTVVTMDGTVRIAAVSPDGAILRRIVSGGAPPITRRGAEFVSWPSLEKWWLPGDLVQPVWLRDDGWAWINRRGGILLPGASDDLAWLDDMRVVDVIQVGARYAVQFFRPDNEGYVVLMARNWAPLRGVSFEFGQLIVTASLPDEALIGVADAMSSPAGNVGRPVLIDQDGIMRELDGPFGEGGAMVAAVKRGSVVEVDTPDDCLNVRASPVSGEVLGCVPHLTLLPRHGERDVIDDDGHRWLAVADPAGTLGPAWVRADFVLE